MKFEDINVYAERFFSIGRELDSGRYYISIPVANRLTDYEEYYMLTPEELENISGDMTKMEALADKCRRRENDERLILQPGSDRGWAINPPAPS